MAFWNTLTCPAKANALFILAQGNTYKHAPPSSYEILFLSALSA